MKFTYINRSFSIEIFLGDRWVAYYDKIFNELRVLQDVPELGIYAARDWDPCAACFYNTGEPALPCAVNPLAFGQRCRDYTN